MKFQPTCHSINRCKLKIRWQLISDFNEKKNQPSIGSYLNKYKRIFFLISTIVQQKMLQGGNFEKNSVNFAIFIKISAFLREFSLFQRNFLRKFRCRNSPNFCRAWWKSNLKMESILGSLSEKRKSFWDSSKLMNLCWTNAWMPLWDNGLH